MKEIFKMKKIRAAAAVFLLALLAILPAIGYATSATPFSVERLVIAEGIKDREPVNVTEKLGGTIETAYCFLEARNVSQETEAVFVWYKNDEVMAKVRVPLGQSSRWRTYTSKKIAGEKGDWKVELQDKDGNVIETVAFKVE